MKMWAFLILLLMFSFLLADGVQPAGSGTQSDPWQVETLDNLLWVSTNDTCWSDYFIQTADIDASATQGWNAGEGFSPIGEHFTDEFTGNYNGQSHTIDGLYIHRTIDSYQGLFGHTSSASISSLGLTNCQVAGYFYTGGMVGFCTNGTVISGCYCTGSVTSSGSDVGGLVGYNYYNSQIIDCYSQCSVTGIYYVGGLAGENFVSTVSRCYSLADVIGVQHVGGLTGYHDHSAISDCYSMGNVDGEECVGGLVGSNLNSSTIQNGYSLGSVSGDLDVGGLVGLCSETATTSSSFWNTETSGQSTSAGGTGLSTNEMRAYITFENAGWDFIDESTNGTADIWGINSDENGGYPFLAWQGYEHNPTEGVQPEGSGTETDPWQIATLNNLLWVSMNDSCWGDHIIQTADINASATRTWNGGEGFSPIGLSYYDDFTGQYDGQHHTIDSLYINRPEADYQGLFGYIGEDESTLTRIGLTNVDIYGRYFVGSFVGENLSSIDSCWCTGVVAGADTVGGMTGLNGGDLANCHSECSVSGNSCIGGIMGCNGLGGIIRSTGSSVEQQTTNHTRPGRYSNISNCYFTGECTGTEMVGGIAGLAFDGSFADCWNSGDITGDSGTGGIVGVSPYASPITGCHNDGYILGWISSGGIVGHIYPYEVLGRDNNNRMREGTISNCYNTGEVNGAGEMGGIAGSAWGGVSGITLSECFNAGHINGDFYAGGITGTASNICMKNCFNIGGVGCETYAGGLVSSLGSSTMEYCYSMGNVFSIEFHGGLIADSTNIIVTACFWDTLTSGQSTSAGGTGLTTHDMRDMFTYTDAGWDFMEETVNGIDDIWGINPTINGGYPFLAWQGYEHNPQKVDPQESTSQPITRLHGNYPNPFNPVTTIRFCVAAGESAALDIYNVRGQRVCGWSDFDPGEHTVVWNGRDDTGRAVGSGVYIYRLSSGTQIQTRRMTMIK